jgi:HEPN domain-containing protein
VTPTELMEKASRALTSARLLLDAGDTDGACKRGQKSRETSISEVKFHIRIH